MFALVVGHCRIAPVTDNGTFWVGVDLPLRQRMTSRLGCSLVVLGLERTRLHLVFAKVSVHGRALALGIM